MDKGLPGTGVGAAAAVLVLPVAAAMTVARWGEYLPPTCPTLPSSRCHALTPASHNILTHRQGGDDTGSMDIDPKTALHQHPGHHDA